MRHPARLVGGVLGGQPARDRRRGPALTQLLADHRAQARRALHGEQLGPLPPGTRRLVCGRGPIPRTAAVPSDLARDHRGVPPQPATDLLVFQGLGQTAGDLLAVGQHQHLAHGASCRWAAQRGPVSHVDAGLFCAASLRTRRAPFSAPGSPAIYAACATGFAWIQSFPAALAENVKYHFGFCIAHPSWFPHRSSPVPLRPVDRLSGLQIGRTLPRRLIRALCRHRTRVP